jgi:hypothetical protein
VDDAGGVDVETGLGGSGPDAGVIEEVEGCAGGGGVVAGGFALEREIGNQRAFVVAVPD